MLTIECTPPFRNTVNILSVMMSVFCVYWEEKKGSNGIPRAVVTCTFEVNSSDCSPEVSHGARCLIKVA